MSEDLKENERLQVLGTGISITNMADTLAISWGFEEEINLNLAEWEALEGTTRGRGHSTR